MKGLEQLMHGARAALQCALDDYREAAVARLEQEKQARSTLAARVVAIREELRGALDERTVALATRLTNAEARIAALEAKAGAPTLAREGM